MVFKIVKKMNLELSFESWGLMIKMKGNKFLNSLILGVITLYNKFVSVLSTEFGK